MLGFGQTTYRRTPSTQYCEVLAIYRPIWFLSFFERKEVKSVSSSFANPLKADKSDAELALSFLCDMPDISRVSFRTNLFGRQLIHIKWKDHNVSNLHWPSRFLPGVLVSVGSDSEHHTPRSWNQCCSVLMTAMFHASPLPTWLSHYDPLWMA